MKNRADDMIRKFINESLQGIEGGKMDVSNPLSILNQEDIDTLSSVSVRIYDELSNAGFDDTIIFNTIQGIISDSIG